MTISAVDFLARCELDRKTLELWMIEEWLVPVAVEPALGFCEADLARVALIRDLTDDLGVNAEGVGIILNLVDQLHNLRNALAETLSSAQLDS
jgi:chaperone modulatory protein CbpM